VQYDFHNPKGDREALKQLAQKLVQNKPDIIVTSSTSATLHVAKATEGRRLPVVFLSAGNPLEFVKSHVSSGNNVTVISTSVIDLTEKRMELLKELVPRIRRVICLNNPEGANYEAHLHATRQAAKRLNLELVEVNVTSNDEVKQKISQINRKMGDGIFISPDPLVIAAISEIAQHAINQRIPSITPNDGDVKRGVLATYSADFYALGQQGAVLVDKILKGVRPADIPIEEPYKLKLVLNLKTAKDIGPKIPREILLRVDETID
jgi:putative ABC transport system substrate-binding protein